MENRIKHWQKKLGILDYEIQTEYISIFQVIDTFSSIGNSFLRIHADHINKKAFLYHTRRLKEDILHELLHVRHPSWSESQITQKTNLLLKRSDTNLAVEIFMKRRGQIKS
jgi:hypothetical protein